jgi:serine/threonine protein phosphatase PrpC
MKCPECGAEQPAGNKFCEDCGGCLVDGSGAVQENRCPPCPGCGAGPAAVDANGFCTRCGCERKPGGRDHLEVCASARLAGVSDRGNCRHRNEDFLALASAAGGDVLVVCDGVSSSQNADVAAEVAARSACDSLFAALSAAADGSWDGRASLAAALRAAQAAVRQVSFNSADSTDPPETTIVAAVRRGDRVAVGWVGDSRAYLVDGGGAVLLTHDHSWMNEVVEAGALSGEAAARHPQAHSITRTLGGPETAEGADEPSFIEADVAGRPLPAQLLLCSDGFWECVPDAEQLAVLCSRHAGDPAGLARHCVAHACEKGGKDNITVAVLEF